MDPLVGMAASAMFGLVALVCGLAAVVTWIVERRTPWPPLGITAASAAVVLGCAMAMPPAYSEAERDRVERLHAQFAPALERYRQEHGEYPPTLQAIGITPPETTYGPLRYQVWRTQEGTSCYSASLGDYYYNGFTASFNSCGGEWHLDT